MLGSHLSIAGGVVNALNDAQSLGFDTVQVFTKNQRQWKITPLKDDAKRDWLDKLKELGWERRTVAHDSYLINLASPDDALWEKSVALMREEIERCDALSIPYLVSHPGAHTGSGVEAGLARIATAYKRLFRETKGCAVTICLENTAGGGSTLGRTFEELAELRKMILHEAGKDADLGKQKGGRVGFCIDTCHALAGGYDITTEKKTLAVLEQFDKVCGLAHLKVLHLNDSKGALDSRIDRHEHLGAGCVGEGAFKAIMNHPALADVPKILETPKGENDAGEQWDTVNKALLLRVKR